jgi:NAD(P)-dependent dehydrogenase (short-subunit alcohol dehydrogenase family)
MKDWHKLKPELFKKQRYYLTGCDTTTLAREGAVLVLMARDTAALEEVAKKVRDMGRKAHVVAGDVIEEDQVAAMVKKALEVFDDRIDILDNVAGVTGSIETPVQDIKVEDFDYVIIANERGTFLPIKHVTPTMIRQNSGKIVNISGKSGLRGYPMRTSCSASKWAVRGITRTVALELGKYNVNVNAVCPGIVETPRMMKLCEGKAKVRGWTVEQVYEEYVQDMALKRVTLGQDVANAVLFLASEDEAGVVTYNASLVALLNHYGALRRAFRPYRAKTKGKVERPFRYIRQDFFLARTFRNLDDLNAQFDSWRTGIANPRVHATTGRIVNEAFAEEQPSLTKLPAIPYSAVLTPSRDIASQCPAGQ